jgi:hypothetical protein
MTATTTTSQFGGFRERDRVMTVTDEERKPITVWIKQKQHPQEEVEETDKVRRMDRHVERKGATPLFAGRGPRSEGDPDEKVAVKLDHFQFGNFDSALREKQYKKDVYIANRLSMLTYQPFEDPDPTIRQRARDQIGAAAKLYGYDRVEFADDPKTHTQALIAFDSKRGEAVVAFRGSKLDNLQDAHTNLSIQPHFEELYGTGAVHTGYHNAVAGIHDRVLQKLQALNQPKTGAAEVPQLRTVCVAGHSQGGGEAQLAALWLAQDGARLDKEHPGHGFRVRRTYSYGAPHVSDDPALAERYNSYGIDMARIERSGDLICPLNTMTPHNSYSNALGGSPQDEPRGARQRVGRLLYINGEQEVRTNPSQAEIAEDANATFVKNHHNLWETTCQTHLHYDKALFLNMDKEDQDNIRKRLAGARKEEGKEMWNAAPGTPRHERAEIGWNAACREQQATVDGEWTFKFDRRHEFHCQQQGPGPVSRSGSSSWEVTVAGKLHSPTETINWFAEEQNFSKAPEGKKLFDQETAHGKGCVISFEFGIDPRQHLNYDRRAATPAHAQLQASLTMATLPRNGGTEPAPVDLEVSLRSTTNRQNVQVDFPPQVKVSQGGLPSFPVAAQPAPAKNGPAPAQPAPAATTGAAPEGAPQPKGEGRTASAGRSSQPVAQPSGPGM